MRRMLSALAVFAACIAAAPVSAGCERVPENAVWGRVSNAAISDYVNGELGGDWDAYLKKWRTRLTQAQGMQARNSMMILNERGLRLQGDGLAKYISDIEARLKVSTCLAGLPTNIGPSDHAVAGAVGKEGS